MPTVAGVQIENLGAFRADIRAALGRLNRDLATALRKAGEPVLADLAQIPARRTGNLAAGYRIRVRSAAAFIESVEPYAAGAEWGQRGKWAGFMRYGPPGRFAWKAIDDNEDRIANTLMDGLADVVEILGWAQ